MSKEFTLARHDFPIADGNCLISSTCTITNLLSPKNNFDPSLLEQALPETNDYYLTNLFSLLVENNTNPVDHEFIIIRKRKSDFFQTITQALNGGAICAVTSIKGTPWVEEILKQKDPEPDDVNHTIVIYGYYQPDETKPEGYFYIADSYKSGKLFISSEDLFKVLDSYWININLFNLYQDYANLKKSSEKKKTTNKKAKTEILKRTNLLELVI